MERVEKKKGFSYCRSNDSKTSCNEYLWCEYRQMQFARSTHLVCRRGMGSEMQRNGSNVLLCFRQWGHVSEHLRDRKQTAASVPRRRPC